MHSEPVPPAHPRLPGSLEAEKPFSLGKELSGRACRALPNWAAGLCRPAWACGLPAHTGPSCSPRLWHSWLPFTLRAWPQASLKPWPLVGRGLAVCTHLLAARGKEGWSDLRAVGVARGPRLDAWWPLRPTRHPPRPPDHQDLGWAFLPCEAVRDALDLPGLSALDRALASAVPSRLSFPSLPPVSPSRLSKWLLQDLCPQMPASALLTGRPPVSS